MRELNACTAEVFRRSEKRIKERRRMRRRALALCIPLCLIVTIWSVSILPVTKSAEVDKASNDAESLSDIAYNSQSDSEGIDSIDSFSFSLTWDCYGVSSYDSKTGKLVKTTDATKPEDYVTTYELTAEQKQKIYDLIMNLNVTDYPDTYNPHADGVMSNPSMTLILSVNTDTVQKTITAKDIAYSYVSDNSEGQAFLSVCKEIRDILISTDAWKSLPEYEFTYS
ncbi:MAG: hypothetical protein K2K42_05795, partial [Eubacterium sp.]|nr:hypothetical protein [Eubacterium sp.]